jgi:ribosomal protein L5
LEPGISASFAFDAGTRRPTDTCARLQTKQALRNLTGCSPHRTTIEPKTRQFGLQRRAGLGCGCSLEVAAATGRSITLFAVSARLDPELAQK